ncbi:MAG: hypothetical protein WC651_03010 [Candidatus Gracilibacteria bacterium]|jgi:hypothetical protein
MAETLVQEKNKSNLSPVAQEVMPYMERLSERFRIRGLVELANKLIRQDLSKQILNPEDKKDFNMVVDDVRTQMMEDLKDDEKGMTIVANYLDKIQGITQSEDVSN